MNWRSLRNNPPTEDCRIAIAAIAEDGQKAIMPRCYDYHASDRQVSPILEAAPGFKMFYYDISVASETLHYLNLDEIAIG